MKCIQMCHFFSFLSRKIVIFLSRSSLAHLSVGRVVNFGGYQRGSKRANGDSAQDNASNADAIDKVRNRHQVVEPLHAHMHTKKKAKHRLSAPPPGDVARKL